MEVSGQLQAQAALTPGKDPGTYWMEGWMHQRASCPCLATSSYQFHSFDWFFNGNGKNRSKIVLMFLACIVNAGEPG
jgi:hypothetical protein